MKLAGKFSPWPGQLLMLALLLTLSGGAFSRVRAGDSLPPVRELTEKTCREVTDDVYRQVQDNPKNAEDIIAYAVKDHPSCAVEIITQGIAALAPKKGTYKNRGVHDPKDMIDPKEVIDPKDQGEEPVDPRLVESILQRVYNYIQFDPQLVAIITEGLPPEFVPPWDNIITTPPPVFTIPPTNVIPPPSNTGQVTPVTNA